MTPRSSDRHHGARRHPLSVRLRQAGAAGLAVAMLVAGQGALAATSAGPSVGRLSRMVTLVTGERVVVGTSPTGGATVKVVRTADSGPAAQMRTLTLNGDQYVIPSSAENYLGRYLDPSLFDVTQLATTAQGDRIPLNISFVPGSTPSLPGVTITSISGGSATGYVTRSSARVLGGAIADQAVADSLAGWPASSPLFGSVTKVAPANYTSPVVPYYPQVTLVITATSRSGGPLPFAVGAVVNADNAQKFGAFVFLVHGEARVSVPVGNYMALFDDLSFATDRSVTIRELVATDFSVTGSQGPMTLDARNATAEPSVTTPLPTITQELDTTVLFTDAKGNSSFSWGWELQPPASRILLTPTAKPSVGKLNMDTRWVAVDPSVPGGTYLFDANYRDSSIRADEAHVLSDTLQADAVDTTYNSELQFSVGGTARFIFYPGEFFAFAVFNPLPFPLHRTVYTYVPPRTVVEDLTLTDFNAFWDPGFVDGPAFTPQPGASTTEHWLRHPYTLAIPSFSPGDPYASCLACKSGTRMFVGFGLNDGDPLHQVEIVGSPNGTPVAHFTVYRDGVKLFSKKDRLGGGFTVPSGPATYRVVEDLDRRFTGQSLSTNTTTDITFRSGQGVPAPPSLYCYSGSTCSVMPVLTAQLDLNATTRGTVPLGTSTFDVAVGHIADAADIPITSVQVEVRRSGATAWTSLPVASAGPGQYQATFNPAAWLNGRGMDTRVTVMDAKGGVLQQTTVRAFVVGP